MGLYEEIVSPYNDINTLVKILNTYTSGDYESVYFSSGLYNKIIKSDNVSENQFQTYRNEFDKYVFNKNSNALFKYLKSCTYFNYDDYIKKELNRIRNDSNLSQDKKEDMINEISNNYFYPLSDFEPILKNFNSFEEFLDFYNRNEFFKYEKEIENISFYPDKYSVNDFLKKNNFPYEMYYMLQKMRLLRVKVLNKFSGGPEIMGFHVNPNNINFSNRVPTEPSDIKFYLNAGSDTYKFAYYFQKYCIENNLNYHYKVANPYKKEFNRVDKMCIYSSFENAQVFLDAVKKIKAEHPDIVFKNPPLMAGVIDGYIGVGQDCLNESSENKESFNVIMSDIIYHSISETFRGVKRKDIMNVVKNDKNKLFELRKRIIEKGAEIGIDTSKMCINNTARKKLQKQGFGSI